ncbi:hypothetical protein BDV96DRAFT_603537 [Lophiotrema nucula]|uniref:Uncharacterized protein n=1 Tax=Lophiotrema nucula TaxID=690887 RepID=A0A6A5YVX3_9PLEO|nr:hypothetical protein BDV96DRAFT_603537 [Lophiotrema nucula]
MVRWPTSTRLMCEAACKKAFEESDFSEFIKATITQDYHYSPKGGDPDPHITVRLQSQQQLDAGKYWNVHIYVKGNETKYEYDNWSLAIHESDEKDTNEKNKKKKQKRKEKKEGIEGKKKNQEDKQQY